MYGKWDIITLFSHQERNQAGMPVKYDLEYLEMLGRDWTGLHMDGVSGKVTHFAYADDVTIILTNSTEIAKLKEIIRLYETASGATINERKSKSLSLNGWNRSHDIFGIPYVESIKILGITFRETVEGSTSDTWSLVTNAVKVMTKAQYYRELCLKHRVQFVHVYLLAKLWYCAQVLPITAEALRQINTTIAWFVWKGSIFRVPLSTLYPLEGSLGLIDVRAKCHALYLNRSFCLQNGPVSFTTEWIEKWLSEFSIANPPDMRALRSKLVYIRLLLQELCYLPEDIPPMKGRGLRTSLYLHFRSSQATSRPMRIMQYNPNLGWMAVWRNLVKARLDEVT
jgi:hypothetical protein